MARKKSLVDRLLARVGLQRKTGKRKRPAPENKLRGAAPENK